MHIKNQAKDKKLWIFALVVLAVAIAASAVIWGERLKVESAYKDVQVAVNIDDMESLANAKNLSMAKMAEELQTRGVSVVLFNEKSVSDLERMGKIEMALGANVKNLSYSAQLPKDLDVRDTDMYLVILDKSWEEQIVKNLEEKVAGVTYYPGEISVAVIPAEITAEEYEKIVSYAKTAYQALDCAGLGRMDFFINRDNGAILLNEINTLPGFTEISMYAKLWAQSGLGFS